MSGFENSMLRQVLSVPDLLDEVYPEIEPQVRYILTTPEIYSIKKVVLTSCGDGYAACLAAKRSFESFLQIPVEVADPLTLSRYYQMKWVGEMCIRDSWKTTNSAMYLPSMKTSSNQDLSLIHI